MFRQMPVVQLNVRLDADLVTAARLFCLESSNEQRLTLREVVEEALRAYLQPREQGIHQSRAASGEAKLPVGRPKRHPWPEDTFVIVDEDNQSQSPAN